MTFKLYYLKAKNIFQIIYQLFLLSNYIIKSQNHFHIIQSRNDKTKKKESFIRVRKSWRCSKKLS